MHYNQSIYENSNDKHINQLIDNKLNPIKNDLTGKLIIVTGSSDGIGLETAKDLLNSNAKIIFACRNKVKAEKIINRFPENLKKNSIFIQLDLNSFKSIENFSKEIKSKYPRIDILINNAGMAADKMAKTEDGYLDTYQVNYLGNALLTLLLFEHFNEKESKIINVSSMAYKRAKITYGDSKYLNNYEHNLFSYQFNKKSISSLDDFKNKIQNSNYFNKKTEVSNEPKENNSQQDINTTTDSSNNSSNNSQEYCDGTSYPSIE